MPSCYILIADQPYEKVIFLRLTKQIKDQLSVFAINTSIQVSSWSAAHSQTMLFRLNITDIIHRQGATKMRLICHLKHSLGLHIKIHRTSTMTA